MIVASALLVNHVKAKLLVQSARPVTKKRLPSRAAAVASHVSKKTCKRAAKPVKRVKTASHAANAPSVMTGTSVLKARQNNVRAMSVRHVNVSHAKKLQLQPLKHC